MNSVPKIAEPTNDGQYALYIVAIIIVSMVVAWVMTNKKSKSESNEITNQSTILLHLQLMETKMEQMVSEIRSSLIGEHKLLKQKVDSIQNEIREFKKEVRGK